MILHKIAALALTAALAASLAGCGANGAEPADGESQPAAPTVTPSPNGGEPTAPLQQARFAPADVDPRLIEAQTRFAFDVYRELSAREAGNRFFSPISLSIALAMTMNGAEGETLDAMKRTLALDALEDDEIQSGYEALADVLMRGTDGIQVALANSLWADEGVPFREAFLDTNRARYDAAVETLDLQSAEAPERINDWVREKTNGKIDKLLDDPLDDNSILLLLNAIYFDANWASPFREDRTAVRPFDGPNGVVDASMMFQEETLPYLDGDGFQAVRLPYAGHEASMVVFVPDENVALDDWMKTMNAASWTRHMNAFTPTHGVVGLPKFQMEQDFPLNDALKNLGMGVAFDDKAADFSRMTELTGNNTVFLKQVQQKTFVDVQEQGTVAAAVTSVEVGVVSAPVVSFELEANRPFFFAIRDDRTGAILFMGAVYDPATA
ncbi:serpin family protein [Paenibacillus sp.]|uniref:serpin family protein n=1 Tax=Paenibacillus sp. TaxID=58172 RepID=UPI002811C423|nr:serpin family protein [Paenibacillus sp.]